MNGVGAVGGSSAVYRAALALGLVPEVGRVERPDIAPLAARERRSVVILGAGISGLVAAYELSRKGYDVRVIEASHRVGGRNWTLRSGDFIDEVGSPQTCRFDRDPDLYFNAGAARIPGDHAALLGYCKELGVQLTPFINENRNALVQDDAVFGGKPIRHREYIGDTRGFVAELVAKSLRPEQMQAPFTAADYERVMDYVRQFGALNRQFAYRGSRRAGYAMHNCYAPSALRQPLDASELLRSEFMYRMSFTEQSDQAAMMLEPVGGMDRIVAALLKKVGSRVRTQSPVEAILLRPEGVDVVYRSGNDRQTMHADFCLNSIPMRVLSGIEHNFPADYAQGFAALPVVKNLKIGLQMKQRFWEREGIYGGISWTQQDIMQVWYPAHGIHSDKGILVGAYIYDNDAASDRFAMLSPPERLKLAVAQGEKLHPEYGRHVESGVSVVWHRMNHILGSVVDWRGDLCERWFTRLRAPVGAHYLIGDQVSQHAGWQEGAVHAAFHAIADIDSRVRSEQPRRMTSRADEN